MLFENRRGKKQKKQNPEEWCLSGRERKCRPCERLLDCELPGMGELRGHFEEAKHAGKTDLCSS